MDLVFHRYMIMCLGGLRLAVRRVWMCHRLVLLIVMRGRLSLIFMSLPLNRLARLYRGRSSKCDRVDLRRGGEL